MQFDDIGMFQLTAVIKLPQNLHFIEIFFFVKLKAYYFDSEYLVHQLLFTLVDLTEPSLSYHLLTLELTGK